MGPNFQTSPTQELHCAPKLFELQQTLHAAHALSAPWRQPPTVAPFYVDTSTFMPHVLYVRATRTSLPRAVRTRGAQGSLPRKGRRGALLHDATSFGRAVRMHIVAPHRWPSSCCATQSTSCCRRSAF